MMTSNRSRARISRPLRTAGPTQENQGSGTATQRFTLVLRRPPPSGCFGHGTAARATRTPGGTAAGPSAFAVSTDGSQPSSGRCRRKRTTRVVPALAIGGYGLAITRSFFASVGLMGSSSGSGDTSPLR